MFHTRNLLQLLHKTSLIVLLALSIIMLFHIFIMTLGTSLMFWHTDSTPFNVALITFLYYVIPVIALLSFNLIIGQLIHIYDSISRTPKSKCNNCSDIPTDEVKKFNFISEDKLKHSKSRAVSKEDSKKSKSKSGTVPKEDSKKSKSKSGTVSKGSTKVAFKRKQA